MTIQSLKQHFERLNEFIWKLVTQIDVINARLWFIICFIWKDLVKIAPKRTPFPSRTTAKCYKICYCRLFQYFAAFCCFCCIFICFFFFFIYGTTNSHQNCWQTINFNNVNMIMKEYTWTDGFWKFTLHARTFVTPTITLQLCSKSANQWEISK